MELVTLIEEQKKEFEENFKNLTNHFTPDSDDGVTQEVHEDVRDFLTQSMTLAYKLALEDVEKLIDGHKVVYVKGDERTELLITSFVGYCITNPEERFFQALRNWVRGNIDADCNSVLFAPFDFQTMGAEEALMSLKDSYYYE